MKIRALVLTMIMFSAMPSFALDRAHFIELNKKAGELAKEKD